MTTTWHDIPNVFFTAQEYASENRNVYRVEVGFLPGRIIEERDFWLLMIQLQTPDKEIEVNWAKYCGLLLAGNSAHQYGVVQRCDVWWLAQRFSKQLLIEELYHRTQEHIAITTLLGRQFQKRLLKTAKSGSECYRPYIATLGLV
ncbi:hypothetical protein QNN88_10210 [Citrobacter sp. ANG330]|uniref:hypothetical protein n=1 Tax=Citrobacter sp. ANG330 TaxID=3048142 RepID=UPI0039C1F995